MRFPGFQVLSRLFLTEKEEPQWSYVQERLRPRLRHAASCLLLLGRCQSLSSQSHRSRAHFRDDLGPFQHLAAWQLADSTAQRPRDHTVLLCSSILSMIGSICHHPWKVLPLLCLKERLIVAIVSEEWQLSLHLRRET